MEALCNFIKMETFPVNSEKFLKNTFSYWTPLVAASEGWNYFSRVLRLKLTCSLFSWEIWITVKNIFLSVYPSRKYMFKVNNRLNKPKYEICSKLTKKTPTWNENVVVVSLWVTFNKCHSFFKYLCCWLWTIFVY